MCFNKEIPSIAINVQQKYKETIWYVAKIVSVTLSIEEQVFGTEVKTQLGMPTFCLRVPGFKS